MNRSSMTCVPCLCVSYLASLPTNLDSFSRLLACLFEWLAGWLAGWLATRDSLTLCRHVPTSLEGKLHSLSKDAPLQEDHLERRWPVANRLA